MPATRGPAVHITIDDHRIPAYAGESLAAALMAAGHTHLRNSPRGRTPRGAFCMMGVCQECLVRIGGVPHQACLVPVTDGMVVTR